MRFPKVCAGLLLAGGVIVTGCKSADTAPSPSPTPTMSATAPSAAPATAPVEAATTGPAVAVTAPPVTPTVSVPATAPTTPEPPATAPATAPVEPPKPAVVVATHVLTKDQPYFNSVPASPTAAPDGTFKAGTKVLVFSFSGSYAKVKVTNPDGTAAEDGTTAYTATEGIDPISKK